MPESLRPSPETSRFTPPDDVPSSDVQSVPTAASGTVDSDPKVDGNECFRRVKWYEVQRDRDRREASRLLNRNYPV